VDFDSADLLARCKRKARRPATDESYLPADWYADMTEAQAYAIAWLVARAPEAQYGAPRLLTSSDGGYTYGFGTDSDGDAEFPIGHCEIYASKRNIPDEPLENMIDFIAEGTKIRILNDRTRAFSDGPYARFVLAPRKIDASTQPTLQPKTARLAIVYGAVAKWASRPGSGADPTYWEAERDKELAAWLLIYRTQYNMQAALGNPNTYLQSIGLLTGGSVQGT
jgi:hypothetical protein